MERTVWDIIGTCCWLLAGILWLLREVAELVLLCRGA